jgi:hypothetical protein
VQQRGARSIGGDRGVEGGVIEIAGEAFDIELEMGRLWTALIVAQVAVTVATLPMATYFAWSALRLQSGGGYATAEFLYASLSLDRTAAESTEAGEGLRRPVWRRARGNRAHRRA